MAKRNEEARSRRDEQLKKKNAAIKAQREEKATQIAKRREDAERHAME